MAGRWCGSADEVHLVRAIHAAGKISIFVGSDQYNDTLSLQRALRVRDREIRVGPAVCINCFLPRNSITPTDSIHQFNPTVSGLYPEANAASALSTVKQPSV
jgi:hypothetical protein